MRTGRRNKAGLVWGLMTVVLAATVSLGFAPGGSKREGEQRPVRLTLDIDWSPQDLPRLPDEADGVGSPVLFELSDGRIVEAAMGPKGCQPEPAPVAGDRAAWRLGAGPVGQAYVRIEAEPSSNLIITAGGQRAQFTVGALLDGGQRRLPQVPITVRVQRLDWDVIEVRPLEEPGPVAPGARVPVTVGFNVLSTEPEAIVLHYKAELRPFAGGEAVWRYPGGSESLTTNGSVPPLRRFDIPMPADEGTYVLEIEASWEQTGSHEGTRLTRWLKRKRPGISGSASRRVTMVVSSPLSTAVAEREKRESGKTLLPSSGEAATGGKVVDSVDLSKGRARRPIGSGRSPAPVLGQDGWQLPVSTLVAAGLRARLRDWVARDDASTLGAAGPSGLAWVAAELKVDHPNRPHRLRVNVAAGEAEALSVALLAPERSDGSPARLYLDTRMRTAQTDESAGARVQSWLIWPDTDRPVVVLGNRSENGSVKVGSIELVELEEMPTLEMPGDHSTGRGMALDLTAPHALARFGGGSDEQPGFDGLVRARNLAAYARFCGANAVVLPANLESRREAQGRLDGQYIEDGLGPDSLSLMLRLLEAQGLSAWVEIDLSGPLPGLSAADQDPTALEPLMLVNREGELEAGQYQVLHPQVRAAVAKRLRELARTRLTRPNLLGIVVRMEAPPTILGEADHGLDDRTYEAFVRENFPQDEASQVPGLGSTDPNRFKARVQFVSKAARAAWLDWRAEKLASVYESWAATVQNAAPGAQLGVITPGVARGLASSVARRAEQDGQSPDSAWRDLGVDFRRWSAAVPGLIVFRGTNIGPSSLAYDVARSPELDHAVARVPVRGAWLDGDLGGEEAGSPGRPIQLFAPEPLTNEPLGHAMAATDPLWVVVSSGLAVGQEERLAQFSKVLRGLPATTGTGALSPRLASGVAVRSWSAQGRTYMALANDSPYEVVQTCYIYGAPAAAIDDLGRRVRLRPQETNDGAWEVVLRLAPFGVAAVRVAAADARVEPGETHLPDLPRLESQAEGIVARLGRLNKPDSLIGPPSPGFERPATAAEPPTMPPLAEIGSPARAGSAGIPQGWALQGDSENRVSLDASRPHGGATSLRLEAHTAPALVASDPFLPPGGAVLMIHTWFRADREGSVRVWVETESDGEVSARAAEVAVDTNWTERLVRLPDLPPAGLDSLRLRYEWLGATPGTVWIDDVSVVGQGPSEPGRRTQRVLLEALQAFRARRYADFARLLGSQRARTASLRLFGSDGPRTKHVEQAADSDLPPDRRLR